MKDLEITFINTKKGFDSRYNFEYLNDVVGYMSNFFDSMTKEYYQVLEKIQEQYFRDNKWDKEDIDSCDFDWLQNECNKILFADFKNLWNTYTETWTSPFDVTQIWKCIEVLEV